MGVIKRTLEERVEEGCTFRTVSVSCLSLIPFHIWFPITINFQIYSLDSFRTTIHTFFLFYLHNPYRQFKLRTQQWTAKIVSILVWRIKRKMYVSFELQLITKNSILMYTFTYSQKYVNNKCSYPQEFTHITTSIRRNL